MNLSNLELNKKYKNYKEISELLHEPNKSGKAKQLQLKDWERYFTYKKDGQGFIITEIYTDAKEKIDNRKGNTGTSEGSRGHNNKYGKYIDVLLENFLYKQQQKDDVIYITNNCLAEMIKMVNYNYRTCVNNRERFHNFLYCRYKYPSSIAENDIFSCIYSKVRPAITSSLNRLQEQDKITYTTNYITYTKHKSKATSDFENDDIKKIEDDTLKEFSLEKGEEISKKKLLFHQDLKIEFYKKLNEKVIKYFEEIGQEIDGFYQGYKIIVLNVEKQKQDKDIKISEKEFNELFLTDVIESIKNNNERIKQKYAKEWMGVPNYNIWDKERITSLKYAKMLEHCTKILISYETLNIVDLILKTKTKKENIAEAEEMLKLFGS